MQKIFEDYGIEILVKNEKYYIRYDAGGIVGRIGTIEVSKGDAMIAQFSEDEAYHVILEYQRLRSFK